MKPTIEVVGRLGGVVSGDICRKNVAVRIPRVGIVCESRDGQTVSTEMVFHKSLDRAGGPIVANYPFKLAVRVIAIVLTLVPITNWDSDCVGIAKRSSFPRCRDAVLVGDSLE